MLHEVRRRADDFEVLHFHTDLLHFPLFEDHVAHTLTTVHGRLDIKDLEEVEIDGVSYSIKPKLMKALAAVQEQLAG